MQRYFPASLLVVLTTLNEAVNLLELVTFISFRGASRTSMPCVRQKQYQRSYQDITTPEGNYQCHTQCLSSWADVPLKTAILPHQQNKD